MTWFVTILFVVLSFGHLSEAKHKTRLKSAVVVGKVYCDTCFQDDFDKTSHFISGALVAVECRYGASSRPIFREEAKTDKKGEFKVRLPFSVSKHVKRIEGCSVELISSSEPYCAVASTAVSSSSLRLKSRSHGTHIFSAGFFTFKPLKQPAVCSQKPSLQDSNQLLSSPKKTSLDQNPNLAFPPPLKDPNTPGDLPPLPSLPIPNIPLPNLPQLPTLPPLPRLPLVGSLPPLISGSQKTKLVSKSSHNYYQNSPKVLAKPKPSLPAHHHGPKNGQTLDTQDFFFPPNPFQPPPLIPNPFQPPPPLIPNPFQPSPPPLFPNPFQPSPPPLFPNPFQPPPAPSTPFFHFPPIPGLTPSPPPPPPTFPFPFPPFAPFPFQPPHSPGTPPASSSP